MSWKEAGEMLMVADILHFSEHFLVEKYLSSTFP